MIFNGYNSAETLFDRLSRVNRLRETDGSGTILTEYDYNGTGRVSEARYPVPSVRNSFHGNDSDGDYEGWDRFGRTLFQAWYKYSSPTGTQDRWNYTYDYAGNRLTRDLDPAQVSGAPTDHDQVYTYDGLQRLANFQQGTIGSGVIVTKKFEQDWTLDQLGNWPTFKQDDDGNGTWDLDQSRSHNEVNELTEFTTTSWVDPAHDAAGNMTTMPQPKNPSSGYTAVYDAWNRLVLLHNNPTFWQINEYDGLGRRRNPRTLLLPTLLLLSET